MSNIPRSARSPPLPRSLSPPRFWYVKLKALCEIRDWEGLEAFAASKRSPIGYEVRYRWGGSSCQYRAIGLNLLSFLNSRTRDPFFPTPLTPRRPFSAVRSGVVAIRRPPRLAGATKAGCQLCPPL
jgi:Vps16, C-terminal region